MYLAVNTRIDLPATEERKQLTIRYISTFEAESSWRNLTGTAQFVVSKLLSKKDVQDYKAVKVGDPVIINAGYNGQFFQEFKGFISSITDEYPVVYKCEDNMFVMKRTPVNKVFQNVSLSNLLKAITPSQFSVNVSEDINLGDLVYENKTAAFVLEELKKWNIYSFFKGDTIYCVNAHSSSQTRVKYVFTKNIIESDLVYQRKDDLRINVILLSRINGSKDIKVTYGEPDGVPQKLYTVGNTDKESLKRMAKSLYDSLKIDGYKGTFTGFGIPYVEHGYTVDLQNPDNTDKNGSFYVDSVHTSLSTDGAYRRKITLGRKAAA